MGNERTLAAIARELDRAIGECDRRHDKLAEVKARAVESREVLIGLVGGPGGGVGRVGELESHMSQTTATLQAMTEALHAIQRKQDRHAVKLAGVVMVGVAAGGSVGGIIAKLIFGL